MWPLSFNPVSNGMPCCILGRRLLSALWLYFISPYLPEYLIYYSSSFVSCVLHCIPSLSLSTQPRWSLMYVPSYSSFSYGLCFTNTVMGIHGKSTATPCSQLQSLSQSKYLVLFMSFGQFLLFTCSW